MAVGAGEMRDAAVFRIRAPVSDVYGNPRTEWQHYGTVYGRLEEKPVGATLFAGASEQSATAELVVRGAEWARAVPPRSQVTCRGRTWNVVSVYNRPGAAAITRDTAIFVLEASISSGT